MTIIPNVSGVWVDKDGTNIEIMEDTNTGALNIRYKGPVHFRGPFDGRVGPDGSMYFKATDVGWFGGPEDRQGNVQFGPSGETLRIFWATDGTVWTKA